LIIDDELDITITLKIALERNGFRTDSYTDPALAYKNFRDGVYDLVLLDIKMPVIDGFLLYQKIKGIDKRVKICFLTASEFFYERIRKEQGFSGLAQVPFLRKPIDMKDLVNAIKKLLESE
jgi:DNA-binding response OmpR family regulator